MLWPRPFGWLYADPAFNNNIPPFKLPNLPGQNDPHAKEKEELIKEIVNLGTTGTAIGSGGIRLGSSEVEITTALGKPASTGDLPGNKKGIVYPNVAFEVTEGVVTMIFPLIGSDFVNNPVIHEEIYNKKITWEQVSAALGDPVAIVPFEATNIPSIVQYGTDDKRVYFAFIREEEFGIPIIRAVYISSSPLPSRYVEKDSI